MKVAIITVKIYITANMGYRYVFFLQCCYFHASMNHQQKHFIVKIVHV